MQLGVEEAQAGGNRKTSNYRGARCSGAAAERERSGIPDYFYGLIRSAASWISGYNENIPEIVQLPPKGGTFVAGYSTAGCSLRLEALTIGVE